MNINQQDAYNDCIHAKGLGGNVLKQHISHWMSADIEDLSEDDKEYFLTTQEIANNISLVGEWV